MFSDNPHIIPKGRPYSCEMKQEHDAVNVIIKINNIDKTREPSFAKAMLDSFKSGAIPIYTKCKNFSEKFFINDIGRILNTMIITFRIPKYHYNYKQVYDFLMKENWNIFYKTYINNEGENYKIVSLAISDHHVQ